MKTGTASQFFTFVLTVFLLASCAIQPINTINKRIVLMEIAYQEVLRTAILYKSEGRLNSEDRQTLTNYFEAIDRSRTLLYAYRQAGSQEGMDNALKVISTALQAARALLVEKQPNA